MLIFCADSKTQQNTVSVVPSHTSNSCLALDVKAALCILKSFCAGPVLTWHLQLVAHADILIADVFHSAAGVCLQQDQH